MKTPNMLFAPSRRGFLRSLLALPVLAVVFGNSRPATSDDLVEVDGWILKRSDLA